MLRELLPLKLRRVKLANNQRQREPRLGKVFKKDSKHPSKLPRISSRKKRDKVTINQEIQTRRMTNEHKNDIICQSLYHN
jgi:hypothetical protein